MSLLDNSYISFVNLDHRKDRLARMRTTLRLAGIKAERTRGILPEEVKVNPDRIRGMLNRPQKGAIGCYFSQVSIIEEARRQMKHAFVMEDDLVFCEDFHQRMAIVEEYFRRRIWDVLWLGGTFHVNPPYWHKERDAQITEHPRIMRTYGAFSTHAYMVNRSSIDRVLTCLEKQLPTTWGIDYSFIQFQPFIRAFAFVPGMVIQYDDKSDIGRGQTIFSNFSKLNGTKENSAYWFQPRMTDFDPKTFNWAEAGQ